MFHKLYDKALKLAAHKRSNLYLSLVSFSESSFFPIPPDIMIVPMVIAKKKNYIKIFLITTIFSFLEWIFKIGRPISPNPATISFFIILFISYTKLI